MIAPSPVPRQNENFVNTRKKALEKQKPNFSRKALFQMKIRVSLKYLWKQFFRFWLAQDPFKINFIDNYGSSKACHTVLA